MSDLTLYNYWRSSSSHRVRIALELKGLSYRYVPVNLLTEEQSGAAHRARSPTGYVPSLEIDGVFYVESVAILELLEERFPTPALLPNDPHGRALVRAFVEIINSGIQPFQNRNVTLYLTSLTQDPELQKTWLTHFLSRGLASLETSLARHEQQGAFGPYVYGKAPSVADVFLVPQIVSAKRFKVDLAPYARVMRAFEACCALPAFQRAAPERQPDAGST